MKHRQPFAVCLGLLLAGAILSGAGCAGQFKAKKADPAVAAKKERLPSGPTKVVVDGTALALGQPEQAMQHRTQFLNRLGELVNEKRYEAARQWVEKHPDLALDILRDGAEGEASKLLPLLAQYHDEHLGTLGAAGSWSRALDARKSQNPAYVAYYQAHTKTMELLKNGKFFEASEVDLVTAAAKTKEPLLAIEGAQLHGISKMLADKPADSVAAFEQAVRVAQQVSPHQAAHGLLLLSEARRRKGDIPGANQAWGESVTLAADLLVRHKPVTDPTLWERALYLHPVGIPFPAAMQGSLAARAGDLNAPACIRPVTPIALCSASSEPHQACEATLWACIGNWRLTRGEPQAAVLAFKRSEGCGHSADAASWCRLSQARALVALGHTPAATAILMQMASVNDGSALSCAAIAELGSLKVSSGATLQGITLLKKALETDPPHDWPNRPKAEADLALALLLTGDETRGLAWLERARRGFQAQGDHESAAQTVWNEARYFEQAKNKKRAAELDEQYLATQF